MEAERLARPGGMGALIVERLDALVERLDALDAALGVVRRGLDALDGRMRALEALVETGFSGVSDRFTLEQLRAEQLSARQGTGFSEVEYRLKVLALELKQVSLSVRSLGRESGARR